MLCYSLVQNGLIWDGSGGAGGAGVVQTGQRQCCPARCGVRVPISVEAHRV